MFVTQDPFIFYFSKKWFLGIFYFSIFWFMLKGRNVQKADVLYHLLNGVKDKVGKMSYDELNILARTIGNSLFDMTAKWSGYKSKELIAQEKKDPSTKKCAEHFYPRQVAGWYIVQHLVRYKGMSKAKLIDFIMMFNQIHYTTSEENTRLVPFQKSGIFTTPEHAYKQAGVELIKVKDVD